MRALDYQHVELPKTEYLHSRYAKRGPMWLKSFISFTKWYRSILNRYFKHVAYREDFISQDNNYVPTIVIYDDESISFYHPLSNHMSFKLTNMPEPLKANGFKFPWED